MLNVKIKGLKTILSTSLLVLVAAFSGANFADSSLAKNNLDGIQLAALTEGFSAEATYMQSCFACHSTGAAGAPKVGDADAWTSRMEKGLDAVVNNAVNGVNAMPPKGMCFTCTDEDLKALVEYMVASSQ